MNYVTMKELLEAGVHFEAVGFAAQTYPDTAKRLRAQVHRPADLHGIRVDIEPAEVSFGETFIIIISLVLHSGSQRHHTKVVRIGNRIDVTCQPD